MGMVFGEVLKVRHPQGHVVEAQFAEGGVEVHFQPGGSRGELGGDFSVIWAAPTNWA